MGLDNAHQFRNSYLSANLTFEDDKITWYCPETKDTREVMMDWEQPIMAKMAEVAVEAGDDVLECGFGMGILSDAVQARNPGSHTIVECHPEILVKARAWAEGKSNVTIIEGKWLDLRSDYTLYDVILMDTYVDDDLHGKFDKFAESKAKDGCKVSWWNFSGGTTDEWMKFYWEDVTFTEVTGLNPPDNTYYNRDNYYIPLKILNRKPTSYGVLATSNLSISDTESITLQDLIATNIIVKGNVDGSKDYVSNIKPVKMKCSVVYSFNNDALITTGSQTLIVKSNGSWVEKIARDVTVGDKFYSIDGTEVEITSKVQDTSDTVYEVCRLDTVGNYFLNNILIKIT
jgi:hypothetical protein